MICRLKSTTAEAIYMTIISHFTPVKFQAELPQHTDVVIIGAGIIGISTAWFLSKSGLKVLVCEKGRVAGEQSSRNWGWVRQQGRDEAELPIMMESIAIWQQLTREIGPETGRFSTAWLPVFMRNSAGTR